MTEVGENLGGVPVIGGGIRVPFDGASQAGGALEAAGQSQQDAVLQLAVVLGVGIAALPILMILALWLIPRVRFVRKSSRARQLVASGAGIDLLALRALANQKLATLARVDPDAMAAWRRGDDRVLRELASLELKSSGVRLQP
jgi:Na+(H+)/acetate symporter ActP